MMDNIDLIEFLQDEFDALRDNLEYSSSARLDDICDILNNPDKILDALAELTAKLNPDDDEEAEELFDEIKDTFTLGEIEEQYPEFYNLIVGHLNTLTTEDFVADIYEIANVIFDNDDPYEIIHDYESLAYCTSYYVPVFNDIVTALKVGLIPFKYDGDFYLALGGYGMDSRPKLDAYVALLHGVIPKDSKFFSDSKYFKYVVGNKVYEKILKNCRRTKTLYTITFED